MTTRTPEELEEKLHYHFKNKELLITALTHSSYANESKTPTLYNERLEFLGDSVLSVVVANYLFHHSTRPEGELSRMRASLVSEDAVPVCAGDRPGLLPAAGPRRGAGRRALPPQRGFGCV